MLEYTQPTASTGYPINIAEVNLNGSNFNTLHTSPLVLIAGVENNLIIPIFYVLEYDGGNISTNPNNNLTIGDLAALNSYGEVACACVLDNSAMDLKTGTLYSHTVASQGSGIVSFNVNVNTNLVLWNIANGSIDFQNFQIKIAYYLIPIW